MARTRFSSANGFTLIELMVTLAVAIILTLWATTAVQRLLERQRLSAAVEAVQAQVVLAKSEAAKQSQRVFLNVNPSAPWSVTLAYADQVTGTTITRAIDGDSYAGVVVQASWAGSVGMGAFDFEPVRGTVNRGRLTLASTNTNDQVNIRLDEVGRMSICSPNFGRYPTCP